MRADGAAVEGIAPVVLALLDEDDRVPPVGQLVADDGAACACPDDDDLALDRVVGPRVEAVCTCESQRGSSSAFTTFSLPPRPS